MNNNEMKDLAKQSANNQQIAKQGTLSVIKGLLNNDAVKKRFEEVLGERAGQFMASITSLVTSSTNFTDVDPNTIIASAMISATLNLPINPNLGFAYLIPYAKKCTYQLGYKGFLQLALRTGQYKNINATEVYEGELASRNRLTGEIEIDESKKTSDKVIGYAAFFKLINGFEKTLYMDIEAIKTHAKRFSKSYSNKDALWQKDFHSMAMKTVLKMLISKYGILSVEMQKAIVADQSVVDESGEPTEYPDNNSSEIDANYEEIKELTPEEWETPEIVIRELESFTKKEEFDKFRAENAQRIGSFGGKYGELIESVIKTQTEKLN